MPYTIQAVIFDLDGVIINSNPAIEAFWKSWTDKEGIDLTHQVIREWIHGRKVGDTISGIFGDLPEDRKKQIQESAFLFDESMKPGPINGLLPFLEGIEQSGLPMGIVTSSHYSRMLNMLTNIGIENLFSHFVTAHDVTKGKPDPEPYLAMSAKMNLAPANCLVFEDAISGIQSAKAAGMLPIGIGDAYTKPALEQEGAKDVIPDFTGIQIDQRTFTTLNGTIFIAGI